VTTRACIPSIALALGLYPVGVGAQTFEISPFGGGAVFMEDLAVCPANTSCFGQTTTTRVTRGHDTSIALGTHVGVRFTRFALEGTFIFVPTDITTKQAGVESSGGQTILIYGANVRVDIPLRRFFRAFVVGGAGVKQHTKNDPLTEIGFQPQFESGIDAMFNGGGGLLLEISQRLAVRLEVRDYVSKFDAWELTSDAGTLERWQHDLLLTVGTTISSFD